MNVSLLTLTLAATATLSANRFVTSVGAVPAAAAAVIGVTRSAAVSGDLIAVDALGTAMVEASAAIAAGAAVATTADGRAVTYATGSKVGIALTAAAAAGSLIEVMLIPNA
jgi:hypothetical protein